MTPAQFLFELAAFAAAHGRGRRDEARDHSAFWWILGAAILLAVGVGVAIQLIAVHAR